VLYQQFLFRMVDFELVGPQGDMSRLLGQFAALLVFLSVAFSMRLMGLDSRLPREALLVSAWSTEHFLIASTMVAVGLFAVLSWDSTFPDRRDVLVLGPLPVRVSTLFLARVAASATALSLTVVALNAVTGLGLPLALLPPASNFLDLILSPAVYRLFAGYWITMMAAGAFIFCSVLFVQGLAAQLLPRRLFLRVSAFLQLASFCLFLSVYFLQPSLATPHALSAPENQRVLAWLPSYWFLGLFHESIGSSHEATAPLAQRAWIGLIVIGLGTAVAYVLSYFRTLRRIIEEPDIMPGSRGFGLPRFGDSLQTAVVHFSVRTLLRSRHHRMMLAFYLGIGSAIVILFMQTPRARQELHAANVPLLFSSLMMMCVCVVGTRVVFSVPLGLHANWIFRMTEIRGPGEYLTAIRRPLFVLAVAPVWCISAVYFLSIWPWRPAVSHLVILGIWGMILAWISLHGFQKIPFTCSWLPGKSVVHMVCLAALGVLFLIGRLAAFERRALDDPVAYAKLLAIFALAVVVVRWRTVAQARSEESFVQFEELPPPAVMALGLRRDGVWPN
jgi:hypothetical protein